MKAVLSRRGFSLIEIMLVITISMVILGATWAVVSAVLGGDDSLRNRVDLQLEASNALKEMSSLLKQSGVFEADSNWTSQPIANADADGEYPKIFPLGQSVAAPGLLSGSYAYANFFAKGYAQTQHTVVQAPNVLLEEGLGPSEGILFRIAKDQDNPDTKRTIPVSKAGAFAIEWGNEFHVLTVAVNSLTGVSELQHQVYDGAGAAKSKTVLARYVSRLLFETKGLPAPLPTPMWPFPSSAQYVPGAWPAPPGNPYEIRITLCLAKPDVNNANNSLTNTKRMTAVWQQTNVIMRSVPR